MAARDLVRGQRIKLSELAADLDFDLDVEVGGVAAENYRTLCFLVGDADRVIGGQEVLYDSRRKSACGAISVVDREPGRIGFSVDLRKTSADVRSVIVGLALVDPGDSEPLHANAITTGVVRLSRGGTPLASFQFRGTDFDKETALVLVEVYRKDVWRLAASGAGFVGGLPALCSRYSVSNDVARSVGRRGPPVPSLAGVGTVRLPAAWPGGQTPRAPGGLLPSVGLIVVTDDKGAVHTGTGFAVGPGGFVLTCAHVIEDAVSISMIMEGTTTSRPAVAVRVDAALDVALLWLEDRLGSETWFRLADRAATFDLGLEVGLLGYPLGGTLGISVTYSHGIVNSLRRRAEGGLLQLDAGAAPGSSGAPVFHRTEGSVVGILTSGLEKAAAGGMLVNFAVDIRSVLGLGWFGP